MPGLKRMDRVKYMPPSPREAEAAKRRNSGGSFGASKSRSPSKNQTKGRNSAPFNMQHILSKVKERDVMKRCQTHLRKYLQVQINLLIPKDNGIDPVPPPSKRLLDLQKLLFMIDDLPN